MKRASRCGSGRCPERADNAVACDTRSVPPYCDAAVRPAFSYHQRTSAAWLSERFVVCLRAAVEDFRIGFILEIIRGQRTQCTVRRNRFPCRIILAVPERSLYRLQIAGKPFVHDREDSFRVGFLDAVPSHGIGMQCRKGIIHEAEARFHVVAG